MSVPNLLKTLGGVTSHLYGVTGITYTFLAQTTKKQIKCMKQWFLRHWKSRNEGQ